MMPERYFTIGHSNRDLETFTGMLREAQIRLVADVRSFPRSRTNPQFNSDTLPEALAPLQIGYRHFPGLGGRRSSEPEVMPATNAYWQNQSFHNYADHALGQSFQESFARLLTIGDKTRTVLMCSEAVWWRCHRRIISDYLLASGREVIHLMAPARQDAAKLTPGAQPTPSGKVIYPVAA